MADLHNVLQVKVPRGVFGGDRSDYVFLALLPVLLEQLRENRTCARGVGSDSGQRQIRCDPDRGVRGSAFREVLLLCSCQRVRVQENRETAGSEYHYEPNGVL